MTIALKSGANPASIALQQQFSLKVHYTVYFTQGLLYSSNPLLSEVIADDSTEPKRVIAVIDAGVLSAHPQLVSQLTEYADFYGDRLTLAATLVVPGGETAKNDPQWLHQIHQVLNITGLCRHSYILGIGGGAVLDLVGYAAATAHRGIRLIRIPTTVLAQNDSGVGVKNGVNAFGKKNFLGTFAPPYAVINDAMFLTTLSNRDWRAGVAEAVKVALIKDAHFFQWIRHHARAIAQRDLATMQTLIYRCAHLHLHHIAHHGDPYELGSSRPLDFGHWAAHRLEHLSDYRLRHGEAVAIGMALDATYSYLLGGLPQEDWQQILHTLTAIGFRLYVPELEAYLDTPEHPLSLFRGLREFQEHLGGELTLMLLQGIGQGVEVHHVQRSRYRSAITYLRQFDTSQPQIDPPSHPLS